MKYTITIQERHCSELKNYLLTEDKKEHAAFIICGRSVVDKHEHRLLTREVYTIPDDYLLTSKANEVSWDNNYFIDILKKAERKNFAIVVIHNHPENVNDFSAIDNKGEYNLFKLAFNRNGRIYPHASLIILSDGSLKGRIWKPDLSNEPISKIRIIGNSFNLNYPERTAGYKSPEIFNRQQLVFGKSLIQDLSKIKISIVGLGATGSATAMLLTRLGVGELCLIDKDTVELSNLNRLHGATIKDVGKYKADIVSKYIKNIGIGTKVVIKKNWVSDKDCINQLKTSDIIFGCTDDNAGRLVLNRFAYFYLIPVIDMGLIISIKDNSYELNNLQGRISYLFPGSDCLLTKGNINTEKARAENLKRNNPEDYIKLKEEAYVIGEGNPSPAVVTFTTQIAAMAVNEFINRIQRYNKQALLAPHKQFFFNKGTEKEIEITPANIAENDCKICGLENYWGRGDMIPFLDMTI